GHDRTNAGRRSGDPGARACHSWGDDRPPRGCVVPGPPPHL
ncbi:MAG: hypothetical protein AVDCRST_MAG70-1188, partial [uncultured Thermomicrobiales bacterium]